MLSRDKEFAVSERKASLKAFELCEKEKSDLEKKYQSKKEEETSII